MFLLVFGLSTRLKRLGDGLRHECPRCRNTSVWQRLRRYHQFTLFFVPVLRWRRQEIEVCPICGAERAAPAHTPSPLPLTHATA